MSSWRFWSVPMNTPSATSADRHTPVRVTNSTNTPRNDIVICSSAGMGGKKHTHTSSFFNMNNVMSWHCGNAHVISISHTV